ncbi:hypothetical protein APS56_13290 [Pseudalgibacter alginicilyticus]|uniref:Secretion system C-terminal sorting domain-containing protein n=1 Tax=Pseudalgibacter alginicilyticus TaxID=1736674 RepID=A0A0P0D537_9FLAO|nr:T9SS type A sorting domain-containing protein [Pseudalgibacter alginicilyticus]ALJ06044.1 hypothetical protein APS56_13290 [Pseudalgibacter alginicilyticus]
MKQQLHNLTMNFTTLQKVSTLVFFFLVSLSYGQIYVDYTATGANDGSSWTDAYTSIQTAVDYVSINEEIRIAKGIHIEGARIIISHADAILKGGYDTSTNVQDGITTLDGENTYAIMWINQVTSGTVLENFTFINGSAQRGAAIEINNATPELYNINFIDNNATSSGGALYLSYGASPILGNVVFDNNSTGSGSGGAIIAINSTLTINNATFTNNNVQSYGGAVDNLDSVITIENAIFKNNSSENGGAISTRGSAETTSTTLTNVAFIDNTANFLGGSVYTENQMETYTIVNALFYNNSAAYNGAVYNSGDMTITNSTFINNSAGLYNGNNLTLFNTVFYNNGTIDINGAFSASTSNIASDNPSTDLEATTGFVDLTGLDASSIFIDVNDPDGADDVWNTTDDGFSLVTNSPLIDAGDSSLITENYDITGETNRIINSAIDIGAYETTNTLSTNDINVISNFLVYPNPATDIINITSTKPITKIELFDLSGKLVLKTTNSTNINISSLHSGFYLLSVFSENTKTVKKLIIR